MTEFLIPIRRYEVREICEYADAKKKKAKRRALFILSQSPPDLLYFRHFSFF